MKGNGALGGGSHPQERTGKRETPVTSFYGKRGGEDRKWCCNPSGPMKTAGLQLHGLGVWAGEEDQL